MLRKLSAQFTATLIRQASGQLSGCTTRHHQKTVFASYFFAWVWGVLGLLSLGNDCSLAPRTGSKLE